MRLRLVFCALWSLYLCPRLRVCISLIRRSNPFQWTVRFWGGVSCRRNCGLPDHSLQMIWIVTCLTVGAGFAMNLDAVLGSWVARCRTIVGCRGSAYTIIILHYSAFDSIDHAFGQGERGHVSRQATRAVPDNDRTTTLKVLLASLDDGFLNDTRALARWLPGNVRAGCCCDSVWSVWLGGWRMNRSSLMYCLQLLGLRMPIVAGHCH